MPYFEAESMRIKKDSSVSLFDYNSNFLYIQVDLTITIIILYKREVLKWIFGGTKITDKRFK